MRANDICKFTHFVLPSTSVKLLLLLMLLLGISVYVFIGNKRLLLRLDLCDLLVLPSSTGDVLADTDDENESSAAIYRTLSELWRWGVRTRELWAISCDVEPKMR
jgi:hypothetical protein